MTKIPIDFMLYNMYEQPNASFGALKWQRPTELEPFGPSDPTILSRKRMDDLKHIMHIAVQCSDAVLVLSSDPSRAFWKLRVSDYLLKSGLQIHMWGVYADRDRGTEPWKMGTIKVGHVSRGGNMFHGRRSAVVPEDHALVAKAVVENIAPAFAYIGDVVHPKSGPLALVCKTRWKTSSLTVEQLFLKAHNFDADPAHFNANWMLNILTTITTLKEQGFLWD